MLALAWISAARLSTENNYHAYCLIPIRQRFHFRFTHTDSISSETFATTTETYPELSLRFYVHVAIVIIILILSFCLVPSSFHSFFFFLFHTLYLRSSINTVNMEKKIIDLILCFVFLHFRS